MPHTVTPLFPYMKGTFSWVQMRLPPPPGFAECACAPWISRAGIGKGDPYTTPAVARRGFLRASLKLVFLPERLNGARRDGQAGAGQRCVSLGPMALEAPAAARRDARAT